MKMIFTVVRDILAVIGLLALITLGIYLKFESDFGPSPAENEEFRLSSPSKEYDAVVTNQESYFSFGSPQLRLYIVPSGLNFDEKNKHYKWPELRTDSILVDKMKWRDDRTLVVVRPPDAQIFNFSPVCYDSRDIIPNQPVQDSWRRVTVLLQTSEDGFGAQQQTNR